MPLDCSTTRRRVVAIWVNVTVMKALAVTGYPLAPGTSTYALPFQYCSFQLDGTSMPWLSSNR